MHLTPSITNAGKRLVSIITDYWGFLAAVTLILIKTENIRKRPPLIGENAHKHIAAALEYP